jgi:hypothetical protein
VPSRGCPAAAASGQRGAEPWPYRASASVPRLAGSPARALRRPCRSQPQAYAVARRASPSPMGSKPQLPRSMRGPITSRRGTTMWTLASSTGSVAGASDGALKATTPAHKEPALRQMNWNKVRGRVCHALRRKPSGAEHHRCELAPGDAARGLVGIVGPSVHLIAAAEDGGHRRRCRRTRAACRWLAIRPGYLL